MRFVPLKSLEQQDIQMLHRIREWLIKNRTALRNQIRGLLAEYGLVMPKGINHLKAHLPDFLEDATNELSTATRRYFLGLSTMTGIGSIVAIAFYVGIGDGKAFKSGRHALLG